MARENSLSAPIGDDEWSRADKSAVGTMNRPLLYDQMILFICLIERDHGDLGHFAAWCEAT